MPFTPKSRSYNQFPHDPNLGDQSKQALDWIVTSINQLLGQGQAQAGQGLQSLVVNSVDPTSSQVLTGGSRTASITTPIAYTSTTTSVSFFWDGTNGSTVFKIYRDDGTVTGPIVAGSPLTITGLVANTTYFFYPYWDETLQKIQFVTTPGTSVGSPPIAYTAQNALAVQQQILRGRIQLSGNFAANGVTTPAAGTGSGTGGSGGGSGGGGGGRYILS